MVVYKAAMTDEQLANAQAILAKGVEETRIGDRMVRYDLKALQKQVDNELLARAQVSRYRKVTFNRV